MLQALNNTTPFDLNAHYAIAYPKAAKVGRCRITGWQDETGKPRIYRLEPLNQEYKQCWYCTENVMDEIGTATIYDFVNQDGGVRLL